MNNLIAENEEGDEKMIEIKQILLLSSVLFSSFRKWVEIR